MTTAGWTSDMLVGVAEMDEAHGAFMNALTELSAMDDIAFQRRFPAVVAQIEADFQREDKLMEDIDYPAIQCHREQHARVLGALHHVMPRVEEGNIGLGRKAVELLPLWFYMHLETMDMVLAVARDCCTDVAAVADR